MSCDTLIVPLPPPFGDTPRVSRIIWMDPNDELELRRPVKTC